MRTIKFLRIVLVYFFLIMSSSIWSMTEQAPLKNDQEHDGVTIEEIVEHWRNYSKDPYDAERIFTKLGWISFGSIAFPGAGPGIFLSGISCDEFFKQGIVPNHSSNVLCPLGLVFCSVPVILTIATLCSYPTIKIINYFSKKMRALSKGQIELFVNGRAMKTLATYDDILKVGSDIFFWSAILPKLNTAQALALTELTDSASLSVTKNNFCDDTKININKFLRMQSMDKTKLYQTLTAQKMIDRFSQHPHLWQALMRALPDDIISDVNIKDALTAELKKNLKKMNRNFENTDEIFDLIRHRKASIDLLNQGEQIFLNLSNLDNNKVKIISHRGIEFINQNNLITVSHYFRNILISHETIDFSRHNIDPFYIDIVLDIAQKKYPTISSDNVLSILKAAYQFSIPWAFQECDSFIIKNELFDQIFAESEKKGGNFQEKLAFTKKYSLLENRKLLLIEMDDILSKKINDIDNLHLLTDLKLLDKKDFIFLTETAKLIEMNFFHEYFLIEISKFADVPFIKELLVNFFSKEKSEEKLQYLLETIFAIPPEPLVAAINSRRALAKK